MGKKLIGEKKSFSLRLIERIPSLVTGMKNNHQNGSGHEYRTGK